ncbi:ATP-binding protein [Peptacetobacter hominis]|uniref:ATP-binding protein n=1 Tax=Peptacetobacter hominis TaxID=2743610 RepID=A0A544QWR2_9FIRM|nr:ATP-binding protein [Peptacetobacter hominis]TQQ85130.1 ATP-binding protein [Peptacetobacter hominis]
MKIYALVGKSGTGKSHKAIELSYEKDIDWIIDDGLLIHRGNIVAGKSAKQSKTKVEAVRTAIFSDETHRKNVREKINSDTPGKILVIGTSDKMVNRIAERLDLGTIYEYIYINTISTDEEIEKARECRKNGRHIIPAPTVQVKNMVNGISINSLRGYFVGRNNEIKEVEKTVIRPTFSYIGGFYISPDAVIQIIRHVCETIGFVTKVKHIDVENSESYTDVNIGIFIDSADNLKMVKKLQFNIKKSLETMTMINIRKVNINIIKIKK